MPQLIVLPLILWLLLLLLFPTYFLPSTEEYRHGSPFGSDLKKRSRCRRSGLGPDQGGRKKPVGLLRIPSDGWL
ncbi:hypothetical protein BDV41DRAFT_559318 [Aspergillus transmontanensis]|uniref:Uncharacterized protein n=1 Tax=Aspergillus transmontanensis TaxID=1034304 RepID=A0A5N6VDM5_9EURO|nr:hypothetical protein BDV41DRAFT_559318 [Aspergillus transmontanensis]